MATVGTLLTSPFDGFSQEVKPADPSIKKVHVIFKTHLDVGFTKLAGEVVKTYMQEFIPNALALSEKLRQENQKDRYVWSTGSWLVHEFLEQAEPADRKRMEAAIERGDIAWHALPFTTHSELADPSLYELGIQLSAALDKRFGKKTIAAKMTDVPGHTRGLVPILAKNGVRFLHIGVNSASMPPDVPPLFVWRAPDGSEVVVMYQQSYGNQMALPGTSSVMAINFTGDNHGPHKPEQIARIYSDLRRQYPNAEVQATNFNVIAEEVATIKGQLPVVTQELGDTWIHGTGSDPLKVANMRELERLRNNWLKAGKLTFGSPADLAFGIPLLMIAEHTWGADIKRYLKDWDIYALEKFKEARSKPNFKMVEQSWQEKREYIDLAVRKLSGEMAGEAKAHLQSLRPLPVKKDGFTQLKNPQNAIVTRYYQVAIDPATGGIIHLKDKATGADWADPKHPLCQFAYQAFAKGDYDRFLNQYLTKKPNWALDDFGKTGMEVANAPSGTWLSRLKAAFVKEDKKGKTVLLELVMTGADGKTPGGSPANLTVELHFPDDRKEMQITLQCLDKQATRLPEASWFSFVPPVQKGAWIIDKMGQPVDARDVVKNGNRKLHAVKEGVRFENGAQSCSIASLDVPLVAPGERALLNFDNRLPEVGEGVHFCLHNNVWGTNFRMWFDDDMKYRFLFKS